MELGSLWGLEKLGPGLGPGGLGLELELELKEVGMRMDALLAGLRGILR